VALASRLPSGDRMRSKEAKKPATESTLTQGSLFSGRSRKREHSPRQGPEPPFNTFSQNPAKGGHGPPWAALSAGITRNNQNNTPDTHPAPGQYPSRAHTRARAACPVPGPPCARAGFNRGFTGVSPCAIRSLNIPAPENRNDPRAASIGRDTLLALSEAQEGPRA